MDSYGRRGKVLGGHGDSYYRSGYNLHGHVRWRVIKKIFRIRVFSYGGI